MLLNFRVMVIPIVIGALRAVYIGLEERLEQLVIRRRIETIETWPESPREHWRPEETCRHTDSSKRPLAIAGVKKLARSKIINMFFQVYVFKYS